MSVATGLATPSVASYAGVVDRGPGPEPTLVLDVLGTVAYAAPSLVAILLSPRALQRRLARCRTILDAAVITTGFLVVSWITVLPDVSDAGGSTAGGLDPGGLPDGRRGDPALVLTLGVRQHPDNRATWLCFGTGVVVLAVTDSAYVTLLLTSGLDTGQLLGSPLAVGWMVAGALVGLSTLVPRR